MTRDPKRFGAHAGLVLARGGVLLVFILATWPLEALAHDPEGQQAKHGRVNGEQVVLTGKLVDATWFFSSESDSAGEDQITRATNRIAAGTPAGLLPDGGEKPEDIWYLLTNAAALAPYAGKPIKVEGRAYQSIHAVEAAAVYVKDGEEWREVQLQTEAGKTHPPESVEKGHEHAEAPAGHEAPEHHGHASAEHAATTKETAEREHGHSGADEYQNRHESDHGGAHEHKEGREHKHGGTEEPKEEHEHDHDGGHEHGILTTFPPPHPLLVNFTAALLPCAVFSDWLGRWLRRSSLRTAAWWMLLYAAVVTPFTALAGWMWFDELGEMGHAQMTAHRWMGTLLAIALPLLAVWRGAIYRRTNEPGRAYLFCGTLVVLALVVQAHLGATMTF